jgi:hypothetical protein
MRHLKSRQQCLTGYLLPLSSFQGWGACEHSSPFLIRTSRTPSASFCWTSAGIIGILGKKA